MIENELGRTFYVVFHFRFNLRTADDQSSMDFACWQYQKKHFAVTRHSKSNYVMDVVQVGNVWSRNQLTRDYYLGTSRPAAQ